MFPQTKGSQLRSSLLVTDSPFGRVCQSGRYMASHVSARAVSRCFDEADSVMAVCQTDSSSLPFVRQFDCIFISPQVALRCSAGQDLIPSTSPKYIQAAAFRTPWAISRIPHASHHQKYVQFKWPLNSIFFVTHLCVRSCYYLPQVLTANAPL